MLPLDRWVLLPDLPGLWGLWLLWGRSGLWLRHFPLCLPVPWGRWLLYFRGLPLDLWDLSGLSGLSNLSGQTLLWDLWGRSIPNSSCHGSS